MNAARQPKGIPAGGQFAPGTRTEPDLSLADTSVESMPGGDMSHEQIRQWVAGQASHHISPVIGWLRMDAADGTDTSGHVESFRLRVDKLAADVAERFASTPPGLAERTDAERLAREAIEENLRPVFGDLMKAAGDTSRITAIQWRLGAQKAAEEIARKVTAPAPVLDGFTAAEIEDHLQREQHERQCACDLPGDVCRTESYGENWRGRMFVADVEGIFDTIQEMAAARAAAATAEESA